MLSPFPIGCLFELIWGEFLFPTQIIQIVTDRILNIFLFFPYMYILYLHFRWISPYRFSGAYVAKKLEDHFQITFIDEKDYFEFTPSVLR